MATLGWIALAFGGAHAVSAAVIIAMTLRGGGLESLPGSFMVAALSAAAWLAIVAWISPLTIGWG